mgnify:CR=1 FL=1
MENRKRNVHLHVMVTPDELAAIHERMTEAGISNAGAYVRKMALKRDYEKLWGEVSKVLRELSELVAK